jgi:hypothetical protein
MESELSKSMVTLPHHTTPKIDEIEFAVLQGQMENHLLSQLVYEWFGKNEKYEALMEPSLSIPEEDTITTEKEFSVSPPEQNDEGREENPTLHSMANKYHSFLED